MYFFIIALLFILAILILSRNLYGNITLYLKSSLIGHVFPLRLIFIVTSLGLIIGTAFSGQLIYVVEKNIFYQNQFTPQQLVIVLFTILFCEILYYNYTSRLGIPSSVTASLLFALLGATASISVISQIEHVDDNQNIIKFINQAEILRIISAILISIALSFLLGFVTQKLTYLFFKFKRKTTWILLIIFASLFISLSINFVFIKGYASLSHSANAIHSISLEHWIEIMEEEDFETFQSWADSLKADSTKSELNSWIFLLQSSSHDNYRGNLSKMRIRTISGEFENLRVPISFRLYFNSHIWQITTLSFLLFILIFLIVQFWFKANFLKLFTLFGLLILAICFSANDLTFFISLPLNCLASLKELALSFKHTEAIGNSNFYNLSSESVYLFLLISGLILIISLWLKRMPKSYDSQFLKNNQPETISLDNTSTQKPVSYFWNTITFRNAIRNLYSLRNTNEGSESGNSSLISEKDRDIKEFEQELVMISLILYISIFLISWGTSMKIPLASTYIVISASFGVYLARINRERDKTILRSFKTLMILVSWIINAIAMFVFSFIVAFVLYETWLLGIVFICIFVFLLLIQDIIRNRRKLNEENKQDGTDLFLTIDGTIYDTYSQNIVSIFMAAHQTFEKTLKGLTKSRKKDLKDGRKTADSLNDEVKILKRQIPVLFKELTEDTFESGLLYVDILDALQGAMHCLNHIVSSSYKYIDSNNKPLTDFQIRSLRDLVVKTGEIQISVIMSISESNFSKTNKILAGTEHLLNQIERYKIEQLKLFRVEPERTKTQIFYLDILNEIKKYLTHIHNGYKILANDKTFNSARNQKSV